METAVYATCNNLIKRLLQNLHSFTFMIIFRVTKQILKTFSEMHRKLFYYKNVLQKNH